MHAPDIYTTKILPEPRPLSTYNIGIGAHESVRGDGRDYFDIVPRKHNPFSTKLVRCVPMAMSSDAEGMVSGWNKRFEDYELEEWGGRDYYCYYRRKLDQPAQPREQGDFGVLTITWSAKECEAFRQVYARVLGTDIDQHWAILSEIGLYDDHDNLRYVINGVIGIGPNYQGLAMTFNLSES